MPRSPAAAIFSAGVAAALALAPTTPATAQADPLQRIVRNTVGCPEIDDYKRLAAIGESRDRVAFDAFVAEHGCRNFDTGERAWLHEVSMWNRVGCLRPVGQTRCYWVRVLWYRPEPVPP